MFKEIQVLIVVTVLVVRKYDHVRRNPCLVVDGLSEILLRETENLCH